MISDKKNHGYIYTKSDVVMIGVSYNSMKFSFFFFRRKEPKESAFLPCLRQAGMPYSIDMENYL